MQMCCDSASGSANDTRACREFVSKWTEPVFCMCLFHQTPPLISVSVCVCLPPSAAGSQAAGEGAPPAALPRHPARRARVAAAPHSRPPAGEGPEPRDQRARHPAHTQQQRPPGHPVHPFHPVHTRPGGLQHAGVRGSRGAGGAGGARGAEPQLREPRSRERLRVLPGWKRADRSGSSHSRCRGSSSSSTEWDLLTQNSFSYNINFVPFQFSTSVFLIPTRTAWCTPAICKAGLLKHPRPFCPRKNRNVLWPVQQN